MTELFSMYKKVQNFFPGILFHKGKQIFSNM